MKRRLVSGVPPSVEMRVAGAGLPLGSARTVNLSMLHAGDPPRVCLLVQHLRLAALAFLLGDDVGDYHSLWALAARVEDLLCRSEGR